MASDSVKVVLECNSFGNIVTLNRNSNYEELVALACSSWNFLNAREVVFNYCLPELPTVNIILTNDLQMKDALELIFRSPSILKISVVRTSTRPMRTPTIPTVFEFVGRNPSPYVSTASNGHNSFPLVSGTNDVWCSNANNSSRRKLVNFWNNELIDIGQCFENVVAFRKALVNFSICWGFNFKYIKNDLKRVTACCEKPLCCWRIYATCVENGRGTFQIKDFNKEYSCGGGIGTLDHPRASQGWVSDVIVEKVKKNPLYRPKDLRSDIHMDYVVDISYSKAWSGKEVARKMLFGEEYLQFEKLRLYSYAITKTNPSSYVNFSSDPNTGRFKRFFVCYHVAMVGFHVGCRPLLFLDGTFLKRKYQGCLLSATRLNGDNELFPLASGIVDSENEANWEWFLVKLKKVLDVCVRYTFVSDRCKGLVNGIPSLFVGHFHAFCLRHLEQNFKVFLGGRPKAYRNECVYLFNSLTYACTVHDFQKYYDELTSMSERIKDWIHKCEMHHWCNHVFYGERYGNMYSNPTESFNAWILDARHLAVDELVDKIRMQNMEMMSSRKFKGAGMESILCPAIEKIIAENMKDGRGYRCVLSDLYDIVEVHSDDKKEKVNLITHACSCGKWQVTRIPCNHACISIQFCGRNIYEFCDPYLNAHLYRQAYALPILPIADIDLAKVDPTNVRVSSWETKVHPGRPKRKRIISDHRETVKCSRCGIRAFHNRRTCSAPIDD